jgi:hypothetical protein
MRIIVRTHSKVKKDFTKVCATYFMQYFNLHNSNYKLSINFVSKLLSESKVYGLTYKVAEKHIVMDIDSKLPMDVLIGTLAHEIVHVKQFILGQLREYKVVNGKTVWAWCGKPVRKKYFSQPWEVEAYSMEHDLSMMILEMIEKNNDNVLKV